MARFQPWKITVDYTSTRTGSTQWVSVVESVDPRRAAGVVERDVQEHLRKMRASDGRITCVTIAPVQTPQTLPHGVRCGSCSAIGAVKATDEELILAPYQTPDTAPA
ncbi:hypothetical protein, partial [Streptomyces calidiresistens]